MAKAKLTAPERFWSKVKKTDTCWNWTAFKDPDGYGQFWLDGRHHKAHRVAYTWQNGDIPDGAHLDHKCHNSACVNPEHLRPVDHKQNQENRASAQRNSKSGVRGVSFEQGKWRAQVVHRGVHIRVGMFSTIAEAEAAVIDTRNELFTHNDLDRIAS